MSDVRWKRRLVRDERADAAASNGTIVKDGQLPPFGVVVVLGGHSIVPRCRDSEGFAGRVRTEYVASKQKREPDPMDADMEHRVGEAKRIKRRFPDRIPVIVERDPRSTLPMIDKNKFLVPKDLSYAQFMFVVRKRIRLNEKEAIFMMCNGNLPMSSSTMENVYSKHKSSDEFLYLTYTGENAFG